MARSGRGRLRQALMLGTELFFYHDCLKSMYRMPMDIDLHGPWRHRHCLTIAVATKAGAKYSVCGWYLFFVCVILR